MMAEVPQTGSRAAQHDRPGATRVRVSPGRTIQSVDRAIDVLEVLAHSGAELPLKEIAQQTGLNISTCHHLLATLVNRGYVGRSRLGRLYFISGRVSELSRRRYSQFNIVEIAMPELRQVNQETGEAVNLSILQGHELVTPARLDSSHPIRVAASSSGEVSAVHATAAGKAILAWLPEAEISKVLAETGLKKYTDHTITDMDEFMEELRHVRRNGFASDREEFQPGVRCIGSAIRDSNGAVMAAVSCSMPQMRATDELLDRVRDAVRDCVKKLSEQLGSPE